MPILRNLICSIELSQGEGTLQEFGTTYNNEYVETFVAVPSKPQSFSVHLTSDKFIAPGLAMYVFIDGMYQCNRNRQDLKLQKDSDSSSLIDFRVRQKEEKQNDGSMIAREWSFEKLNTSADGAPQVCSDNILDNIGCIEVVVLRCVGSRNAKTTEAMNMDGATDGPDHHSGRSAYDDRKPLIDSYARGHGLPPPLPFAQPRSPYAETIYTNEGGTARIQHGSHQAGTYSPFSRPSYYSSGRSRYSEPISPGGRPLSTVPSDGFQYGSGPIPIGPMVASERSFYHTQPSSVVVANAPGVDPAWLNELLTKAVKRGVEESRLYERPTEVAAQSARVAHATSQLPGAWPQSPYNPTVLPVQPLEQARIETKDSNEDHTPSWSGSQPGWEERAKKDGAKSKVVWDEESGWDSKSNAWSSGIADETPTDSWDTDDTWTTKKPKLSSNKASTTRSTSGRRHPRAKSRSLLTDRSGHSRNKQTGKSRSVSRSRRDTWGRAAQSSSEDVEGWTHVDASSDSPASWEISDDTVQPSQSRSQVRHSRSRDRSRRPSYRPASDNGKRRSSQHLRNRHDEYAHGMVTKQVPSVGARERTTLMGEGPQVPASTKPAAFAETRSQRPTQGSVSALSSSWGKTKHENVSKHKNAPGTSWTEGKKHSDARNQWNDPELSGWKSEAVKGWDDEKAGDMDDMHWGTYNDRDDRDIEADIWAPERERKKASNDDDSWATNNDTWKMTKVVDKSWSAENTPSKSKEPTWSPKPKLPSNHRHTTKSLSKYRPHRFPALQTNPKTHWSFPPLPPPKPLTSLSSPTPFPPEPLYTISRKTASLKSLSHQVRAGQGTSYGHAIARPNYLDTLDTPYAVFRFKYRSRRVLKSLFGDEVPDRGHLSVMTDKGRVQGEKEVLEGMEKGELVERMVRLKMELEGVREGREGRSKGSRGTDSVARDLTECWVREQSGVGSVKEREKKVRGRNWRKEDGGEMNDAGWN